MYNVTCKEVKELWKQRNFDSLDAAQRWIRSNFEYVMCDVPVGFPMALTSANGQMYVVEIEKK